MNYRKNRLELLGWVKEQVTGEDLKDGILFESNPFNRYFTGILYPISELQEELDDELEEDSVASTQVKKSSHYQPPSSMGFSFYMAGGEQSLRVFFKAAVFLPIIKKDSRPRWEKQSLGIKDGQEIVFNSSAGSTVSHQVWDGKARIEVIWRPYGEGQIATVTMTNTNLYEESAQQSEESKSENPRKERAEKSLFEVELKCIVKNELVFDYPRVNKSLLSDEEKEIELRYADERIYAIGHGVAVDWSVNTQGDLEIFSDFMPAVEVPQVTADTSDGSSRALSFDFLTGITNNALVIDELKDYVKDYRFWISQQQLLAGHEEQENQVTVNRIIENMLVAESRMLKGVALLENDNDARKAFSIANQVMLAQMRTSLNDHGTDPQGGYSWRPFQLAFILMVLDSAVDEDSDFRDIVDLIWFPTGGGKTEAYLGLMVFMFVYRRMKYPASSGGTVAIMRYTLRLLTSQQFMRACKVISALELVRQQDEADLGQEPFTVGLWLGSATTPNTFKQAKDKISDGQYNKLVLTSCPWCQHKFSAKNYIATEESFHFTCVNKSCDFGRNPENILPCNVVDEALYQSPPSLLIATVDKFARLAWEERAGSFFGKGVNRAPELIIQDELHLISGALGSIVGLYEVGFETILLSKGVNAKYIASTATIKSAKEQVKALFARDMKIFPPVGLRHTDSYFAKTVPLEEKAGRLYVGFLGYDLARVKSLEPLAGALLAAPAALFKYDEALMDAWWTQIIYHGSLKGVGNSRTNYQSGVLSYLNKLNEKSFLREIDQELPGLGESIISSKNRIDEKYPEGIKGNEALQKIHDHYYPVRELNIKSLTSNQSAQENHEIFEALNQSRNSSDGTLDVALATNMISVGLDVSRLALMIINGQPLTTAEYIQASSRVGRGEVPGLVFVNYYKTQARSLSHYENFKSYHNTFYRYVEPSSLTPFTYQVRQRALHAALVIAMRHSGIGLLSNKGAENFNAESAEVKKVIKAFKIRIKNAFVDTSSADKALAHVDHIIAEWQSEVDRCHEGNLNLRYNPTDKSAEALLVSYDESNIRGLWKTLNSMRNVEKTGLFRILRGVKNESI